MIKNQLEQDENDLLEMHSAGETVYRNTANSRLSETEDDDNLLELPELTFKIPENSEKSKHAIHTANNDLSAEIAVGETPFEEAEFKETQAEKIESEIWLGELEAEEIRVENSDEKFIQPSAKPESIAETTRQSGLAYGAAITLFGSVVFLLALGWLADWLFGTSPWGIVIGIVLGAVIGFYQFFRISSQIFKK